MADIFISYASEDRARAEALARALETRGWSIWWDREIPLGKSFDDVIEKALADAKCAVVLWSAVSVASEWVRNEASEARRRGILIPAFLESVEPPLAFRLLNGADLRRWSGDAEDPEFLRLSERVLELLAQKSVPSGQQEARAQWTPPHEESSKKRPLTGWLAAIVATTVAGAGIAGYVLRGSRSEPPPASTIAAKPEAESGSNDMEKTIRELAGSLGTAIPATSLAKGFYVPDLGVRLAFLTAEQSAATLGAMPPGAVVMEVESGRPMAHAGIHTGDVIVSVAGKKIASEDDLRQAIFKIGPGKTDYSYRRGGDVKTVAVECPNCKVE
jgi:hypothetical protein